MPLGLQKGTHVLRNPKLLESLVQPPLLGAEQAADGHEPVLQQDPPQQQAGFKALMSRLQADIVEASKQDTIKLSPGRPHTQCDWYAPPYRARQTLIEAAA